MKRRTHWYLDNGPGDRIADHYAHNVDESATAHNLSFDAIVERGRVGMARALADIAKQQSPGLNNYNRINAVGAEMRGRLIGFIAKRLPFPCSFDAFKKHPACAAALEFLCPPRFGHEQFVVQANLLHQELHRHKYGRVYEVSPGLCERLESTELKGLMTDDCRLPHPAIQIFAPPTITLQVYNEHTKYHQLHSVYVVEVPSPKGRQWRLCTIGCCKGRSESGDPDDAVHFFDLPLPPSKTLDEAVEAEAKNLSGFLKKRNAIRPMSEEHIKSWDNDWKKIFNWVLNVVMYATSSDARDVLAPEVEEEQRRSRKRKSGGGGSAAAAARWRTLGRRRILGHEMSGIPRDASRKQTLVSGHFRNQACGPRWTEHKRIFVEPFYRNVDADEQSATQTRLS